MISSYRLGDLVLLNLDEHEKNLILNEHPNSIGSKFILEKNKNTNDNNIDIITKIVNEEIEKNIYLLPEDIEESTVIHLRLGDVVAGNKWYEKYKRPFDIDYIKSLLSKDTNKKYILGNCHFGEPSSNNYDNCILLSQKYLNDVQNSLNAQHFHSGDPDIDLCCAIKSKLFLQGRGYYSQLIVNIRKNLNLPCIETECFIEEKTSENENNMILKHRPILQHPTIFIFKTKIHKSKPRMNIYHGR